jgi:hypothetical protein
MEGTFIEVGKDCLEKARNIDRTGKLIDNNGNNNNNNNNNNNIVTCRGCA